MNHRVVVIGAGISGLSLGWFLKKKFNDGLSLTILEADHRAGGWIRSHKQEGFVFEEGPRSCRSKGNGAATLRLIEELDLCEEVISASPEAKIRYIYLDGKLQAVPNSFLSFLFSPLMKGVLPALLKEWRLPPTSLADESIAAFIGRRLNSEIAAKLMDPLVSGIYAGDINTLSMKSCFPEISRMERDYGSLVKGMFLKKRVQLEESPFVQAMQRTPVFTFHQGMETLVSALYDHLQKDIRLSSLVQSLQVNNDGVEVKLQNGDVLHADQVFLTTSAQATSKFITAVDEIAARKMTEQKYATVAVVNMGWNKQVLSHPGFGYLVPSSQKQDVLGVVFDSSAFSQQNEHEQQTRLTVMLGGVNSPNIEKLSEDAIKENAFAAVEKHLNIETKPEIVHLSVAKQAIPQYNVGHHEWLKGIEDRMKVASNSRITLLGSSWYGVAVNDCIAEAEKAAQACLQRLVTTDLHAITGVREM
jgi:oxygen-dependent protoporphyrinogen oxidase